MGKVLHTGDAHIYPHKQSWDRLDDGVKVLEWINRTAIGLGCERVHFLGDLFQDRQRIHTPAYQRVFETFCRFPEVQWDILLGNHDLWFAERWDVNSIAPFAALPNVRLIAEPTSTCVGGVWFDWLPFVKNPVQAIRDHFPADRRAGRVLCGHIAVDGASQGRHNHAADVSVEFEGDMVKVAPAAFAGWRQVFLGHYHHAQFLDERMQYVGSPYQINFSETGHVPHLVVLDTATMTLEYVENTFSPRHLIVAEAELPNADVANNFIKVVGDLSRFDAFEVSRTLAPGVRGLEFLAARSDATPADGVAERFSVAEGETIERYIDAVGAGDLERARLHQTAREIREHVQA